MPEHKSPVGYRRDDDITSKAKGKGKGKGDKKFDNQLSSIVNDFFYEFGIIKNNPKK